MSELGVVLYRGPSLLTGAPVVALLTGLEGGSGNPKTGPMAQAWILCADASPTDAIRAGTDDAVCGDCALRGDGAVGRACYVTTWFGPLNVWKSWQAGAYAELDGFGDLAAIGEGQDLRLGAYGDPAAVPFEVWRTLLTHAAGWVGYTHAWRTCDPRFRAIVMASADTEAEAISARLGGWRTFRIRGTADPLMAVDGVPLEFACPASDEMQHRTTCQQCQLCRGTASPARSVAIVAHGKAGNLAAFYRTRPA